jgi:hypothetical protein
MSVEQYSWFVKNSEVCWGGGGGAGCCCGGINGF